MRHSRRLTGTGAGRQAPRLPAGVRLRAGVAGALAALVAAGCGDDNGTQPSNLRFGQVGEIRVSVVTPLQLGAGELQQVLTWRSDGAWQLYESISYRGLLGDENTIRNPGSPNAFAAAYASLITQVNETQGLKLFIETLSQEVDPDCGNERSRISFQIRDDVRDEEARWTRCTTGTLGSLDPRGSGPDLDASRVVVSSQLAREFTQGESFRSAYDLSVPFGTLDRGEDSGATINVPMAFVQEGVVTADDTAPAGWASFWRTHTRSEGPPPPVDWSREMVVIAGVGVRPEAGDSVEVRRILPVLNGTLVEVVERIPGDFCSPASRNQTPFHIVVAPRTPPTIRFAQVQKERVPCGQ